jgi:fluoride exporter
VSTVFYVALAGAAGSVCRYLAGAAMQRVGGALPYGTFLINVTGSFCMGVVMALFALRGQLHSPLRIALTAGFLGGFTTYSAFAFETIQLVENDRLVAAGAYVLMTLLVAALACAGGLALVRWLS